MLECTCSGSETIVMSVKMGREVARPLECFDFLFAVGILFCSHRM